MKVNTKNMRDRIIALSKKDKRYADNDDLLVATIWFQDGWTDRDLYNKLKAVSSVENIRRTRRKLTEEGLIKPSKQVAEARYEEFKQVKMSI